jgi:flagellar basal-body rod protein FlgB
MSGNTSMFGIHANALALRQERMQLLASNVANADTPGYKAQDLNFAQALKAVSGDPSVPGLTLAGRSAQHIGSSPADAARAARFERTALQPSLDGNTVDAQLEHAAYAQAALEYRVSLNFLESRVRGLLLAITGQ